MKFELHNPKGKSPVYYVIRKNRKGHKVFLKYPTGITLKPSQWNAAKQRVREIEGIPYYDWNRTLTRIEKQVKSVFEKHDYFTLTADKVRNHIDTYLERGSVTESEFWGYLQRKMKRNPEYGQLKEKLGRYGDLNWSTFTHTWLEDFVYGLEKEGLARNTIAKKHLRYLFAILNAAAKDGVNTVNGHRGFKYKSEQVYNVYLTEEELLKIYAVDLGKNLDIVRDLFLIGAFSGLRVGNYIDPKLHIGKDSITAIVNKGGGRLEIPLHWMIIEIIKKHKGLPPQRDVSSINKGIKKIAKKAGIKDKVVFAREQGGERVTEVLEKWEMLSSHTARRSFATMMHIQQVNITWISAMLGHKNISTTEKYIKVTADEFKNDVAKLPFWKKKVG